MATTSGQAFEVAENGLPILNSRPGALSVLYMDFDGGGGLGNRPCEPYGGDLIFDATEQMEIYRAWKDVSTHFAMLDVNVTTVAPDKFVNPTSHLIVTPSVSGGAANTNRHGDTSVHARAQNNSSNAKNRTTGISHEFGHVLGLNHQSVWDENGIRVRAYRGVDEWNRAPVMGVDYAGGHYAHWADGIGSGGNYQDDIAIMVQTIVSKNLEFSGGSYSGDGFAPDDHHPEITSATPLSVTNGARSGGVFELTAQAEGVIERYADEDTFTIDWPGGPLTIKAEAIRSLASGQDYASSVGLNLVVVNAAGEQLGIDLAENPADVIATLSMDLDADTYAFHITGAGGIGDLGSYEITLDGDAMDGEGLFQSAAATAGLSAGDAAPGATPMGDGVANLLKFAFNMDLSKPDSSTMIPGGTAGLPTPSILEADGQKFLQIEFVRRKRGGLIYTPEFSTTLEGSNFTPLVGTRIYEDINSEWQRVRVRHPIDPEVSTVGFARVSVSIP